MAKAFPVYPQIAFQKRLHPVTVHQPRDAGFSFILPPTGLLLLPFDLMFLHKIANLGFK